jgi:predicted amidohydrolase
MKFLWLTLVGTLVAASIARGEDDSTSQESRFVRIGHFQCECQQGDFEANVQTLLRGLQQAQKEQLDIVSFPESLLTGYFGKEEEALAHSIAIDSAKMLSVLQRTASFDCLFMVGFNERRDGRLYNTVAVIEKGKLLGRYSKAMPVFRYFEPGREFPVFTKKGLTFGVIICADGGYIEPARILTLKGARLIFAPHYNFVMDPIQHYLMVRNDHVARAVENGVYFMRGNNVVPGRELKGLREGGFGYGDSYLLNPNGQIVAAAGLYQEYLMTYALDRKMTHRNRPEWRSRKSAALLPLLQETIEETSSQK